MGKKKRKRGISHTAISMTKGSLIMGAGSSTLSQAGISGGGQTGLSHMAGHMPTIGTIAGAGIVISKARKLKRRKK